jgi:hypothetical protein
MAACETSTVGVAKADDTVVAVALLVDAVVNADKVDAPRLLLFFLGI